MHTDPDPAAPSALELGQLYLQLHGRLHRLVDDAMTAEGVSLSRCKVLTLLADRGPLNQAAIAAEFGFAPRSVTDLIDGLERDGLAERLDDPADRRSRLVRITTTGARARESAVAVRNALFEQVFTALYAPARREFGGLLHTIHASLAPSSGAPRVC